MDLDNPNHEFWTSPADSDITLYLTDTDEMFNALKITVYTISRPIMYKIEFITNDDVVNSTGYYIKKDAIRIIKHRWMKYYRSITKVCFRREIIDFDPKYLTNSSDSEESIDSVEAERQTSREKYIESNPTSPHPLMYIKTKIRNSRSKSQSIQIKTSPRGSPSRRKSLSPKSKSSRKKSVSPKSLSRKKSVSPKSTSQKSPSPKRKTSKGSPRRFSPRLWLQRKLSDEVDCDSDIESLLQNVSIKLSNEVCVDNIEII